MPSDVTYVWGPTTGHPNGTPTSRQEILHRLHEPTQAIEVGDLGYVGVLGSESQMKPAVPALMKEHWHFTGITLSHLIFFSKPTTSRMLNEEGWIIYIYNPKSEVWSQWWSFSFQRTLLPQNSFYMFFYCIHLTFYEYDRMIKDYITVSKRVGLITVLSNYKFPIDIRNWSHPPTSQILSVRDGCCIFQQHLWLFGQAARGGNSVMARVWYFSGSKKAVIGNRNDSNISWVDEVSYQDTIRYRVFVGLYVRYILTSIYQHVDSEHNHHFIK